VVRDPGALRLALELPWGCGMGAGRLMRGAAGAAGGAAARGGRGRAAWRCFMGCGACGQQLPSSSSCFKPTIQTTAPPPPPLPGPRPPQDAIKKITAQELPDFYNIAMERPKDDPDGAQRPQQRSQAAPGLASSCRAAARRPGCCGCCCARLLAYWSTSTRTSTRTSCPPPPPPPPP
jgi:hypothetical protein